jgi:hypothetical protein
VGIPKSWRSDRAERIKWLLANKHLWGDLDVVAEQMARAGYYSKRTLRASIRQGLVTLLEHARDVESGTVPIERFARSEGRAAPIANPTRKPRNRPLGPATGQGPTSGRTPPPKTR